MTQEDKKILLQDLSARLAYGVKVGTTDNDGSLENVWDVLRYNTFTEDVELTHSTEDANKMVDISEIKPYLFPLSSVTEEIMDEIYEVSGVYDIDVDSPVHIEVGTTFEDLTKIFHVLNKYHIDYRGLIPMGLAKDATNLNIYKYLFIITEFISNV